MIKPKIPLNEKERLEDLVSTGLLDSKNEEEFNDFVDIASAIFDTPAALISLIDKDRQWYKSRKGISSRETPRELSFCAHAINNPHQPFIVENSLIDERFKDNPLVIDEPNVVFYCGVPIVSPKGNALGTLCVIDHTPRSARRDKVEALQKLAKRLIELIEHKRSIKDGD
ncbi:MAG: GAF domain-containing protein [Bacteroidia bacterium]